MAPSPPPPPAPSPDPGGRGALPAAPPRLRLTLALLLLLLGTWFLRWTTAQTSLGVEVQRGPARAGALSAVALLALWGIAATLLLARRVDRLRAGAALTDVAVGVAATLLLAGEHSWIPGADMHGAWLPIFAPLAVLALLEAGARFAGSDLAGEVQALRAVAGCFAAAALAADGVGLLAGIAGWLGLSPLLLRRLSSPGATARGLQALFVLAALAALLAPALADLLRSDRVETVGVYEGQYGWVVLSAALLLLGLVGLLRPPVRAGSA